MPHQIRIEHSAKPWFGPRKRARKYLSFRQVILKPKQTIDYLFHAIGKNYTSIQQVRFIDFKHKNENNFRYTIVLIWTFADDSTRQKIYDIADLIVKKTGWYPLPQGERLKSKLAIELDLPEIDIQYRPNNEFKTPLLNIASSVGSNGGCSLRLKLKRGAILLDSGLPSFLHSEPTDSLCLISHAHQDHSGGLSVLSKSGVPTLMSRATGQLLIAQDRMDKSTIEPTHKLKNDTIKMIKM